MKLWEVEVQVGDWTYVVQVEATDEEQAAAKATEAFRAADVKAALALDASRAEHIDGSGSPG